MLTISERHLTQATSWLAGLDRLLDAMPPEEARRLRSKLALHAAGQLDPLRKVIEALDNSEPLPLLGQDD